VTPAAAAAAAAAAPVDGAVVSPVAAEGIVAADSG
jgi:hypothetical protein